jgi:hypothetical protein
VSTEPRIWIRFYTDRIDPHGTANAAIGYWLVVAGTLAVLAGVAAFLWGSSYPRGMETYWLFRQTGIVLVAGGVPFVLFGMTFRLPLQPMGTVLGGLGVVLCLAATAQFAVLYPDSWTLTGPQPVIGVYTLGVSLLSAGLIVVPILVSPLAADVDPDLIAQPYYELHEGPTGWRWQLYGSDGVALAESAGTFADRMAARADVTALAVAAPTAGIEVLATEA